MTNTPFERSHAKALGNRLRQVRHEAGLSLAQVEEKSDGDWKGVVVGSYERGDRAITVIRLIELARFYGVRPDALLPQEPGEELTPVEKLRRTLNRAKELADVIFGAESTAEVEP